MAQLLPMSLDINEFTGKFFDVEKRIDQMDTTIGKLKLDSTKKDETIFKLAQVNKQLNEKLNRLEQQTRKDSLYLMNQMQVMVV